ncbi:MAG TPA: MFS transporter, partial [Myxococcota bacterium]|nr:MFS transporter [Myxococcota bacterium]
VGVEVAVMLLGRRLLGMLGVGPAMALAALSGLPRWWVVASSADPGLLIGIQVLHGAGFALFWLAGVQWMAERAPREVAASAQSLLAACSYGVGALLGALLAGTLSQYLGTPAIFYGLMGLSAGASLLALGAARR